MNGRVESDHRSPTKGTTRAILEPGVDTVGVESVVTQGQDLNLFSFLETSQTYGALAPLAGAVSMAEAVRDNGKTVDGGLVESGGGGAAGSNPRAHGPANEGVEEVDEREDAESEEEQEDDGHNQSLGIGFDADFGEVKGVWVFKSHNSQTCAVPVPPIKIKIKIKKQRERERERFWSWVVAAINSSYQI